MVARLPPAPSHGYAPAGVERLSSMPRTASAVALRKVATALMRQQPDETTMRRVDELLRQATRGGPAEDSAFERAKREETLNDWLDAHGVGQVWDVSGTLAEAGLSVADMEPLAAEAPAGLLPDLLAWIACELSVRAMVRQVGRAARRISDLVASVKLYSHMDRSTEHRPADVREGLDNTLVVLGHRLRQARIVLTRAYDADVSPVPANAGELNQVWTNLIENALDAMGEEGHLEIAVRVDHPWVSVEITDDGPGIPEDMRRRIFEPFFTTKVVGEGIGLGLDIAHRIVATHQGQIEVVSAPGRTTFCVRLPLAPSAPGEGPASR